MPPTWFALKSAGLLHDRISVSKPLGILVGQHRGVTSRSLDHPRDTSGKDRAVYEASSLQTNLIQRVIQSALEDSSSTVHISDAYDYPDVRLDAKKPPALSKKDASDREEGEPNTLEPSPYCLNLFHTAS